MTDGLLRKYINIENAVSWERNSRQIASLECYLAKNKKSVILICKKDYTVANKLMKNFNHVIEIEILL